jgi:hypothetical protein
VNGHAFSGPVNDQKAAAKHHATKQNRPHAITLPLRLHQRNHQTVITSNDHAEMLPVWYY